MIIYKVTNKVNGKSYVGQTVRSLEERWSEHCKKTNECVALANAIQKYGKESFTIEVICSASSIDDLNEKEQRYIKEFNTLRPNGYNLTTGGLNYRRSEETKKKLSVVQRGENNHRFGKKASLKTKKKMSLSHIGEKNAFFGKTHSEETRKKLSVYRKLQKCPRTGTKHSKKSLKKMSDSHKGVVPVNRKPIRCNENGQVYESLTAASKALSIGASSICACLKGRHKTCKGYTFSYASPKTST